MLLKAIDTAVTSVVVIDRPDNRGFVRTVNEGLQLSLSNDAVFLNTDTVVTARWLDKMIAVAQSRPDVATVTPLTNSGTICSVRGGKPREPESPKVMTSTALAP